MPENRPTPGPIGRHLTESLQELLDARGLSFRRASAAMEKIGRPLPPLAFSRIAKDERRVDVDELVALAILLGVNPNALLFPRHVEPEGLVDLTPDVQQRAYITWGWARGRWPMPADSWAKGLALSFPTTAMSDFAEHTRPDFSQPDPDPAVAELAELQQVIELVLGDPDPAARWSQVRNTILRRFRLAAIRMEELFARFDREAADPDFDTDAATEQIHAATENVRQPATPDKLPSYMKDPFDYVTDPFDKSDGKGDQ